MPVNSDIYGQIQQPQQMNPLAALAQAYQIKHLQSQSQQADRQLSETNELARLYQSSVGADGKIDRNRLYSDAAASGLGPKIPGIQKGFYEADKAAVDLQKSGYEAEKAKLDRFVQQFEVTGRIMSPVVDQPTWDVARAQAIEVFGGDMAAKLPTQYDPALIAQNKAKAMSVLQQVEQRRQAITQEETQRHNKATEDIAVQGQGVTKRGQDLNRQSAVDRLRFDKEAPRGQVVQTDEGPMLVDPRTGEAKPVTTNGQPVQRPLKEIPATMSKAIVENQQSIAKIDRAIAEIDKNPGALGTRHMIPGMETLSQYTDPEGVEARAGVADIGSLVLHDRSGAAVTASETPRLKPFIPSASDTPEVAKKKLARFKQIYEEEAGLLGQTYSRSQGYRESPVLESGQRPAGGPAAPGPVGRIALAAKPIAGAGGKPPAADLSGLEAELKRRGLLK